MTHQRITHAVESFIIINWFWVVLISIWSTIRLSWDNECPIEHDLTRRHTVSYTQFFLSIILIGLLSSWFQQWTEGYPLGLTPIIDLMTGFAILFAVLQCVTGVAMMQQCGKGAPGQMGETVLGLLKVTNSFGVIAFGFACRTIYITAHSATASALLIAIESFVIINFFYSLLVSHATVWWPTHWHWESENIVAKGMKVFVYAPIHIVLSIVLFGLIAGVLENVTSDSGNSNTNGLNDAGVWMILFGLLFSVMEFFTGVTMFSIGRALLNSSAASVTSKVTLAFGALAFGFACRHINLDQRRPTDAGSDRLAIIHAIESFIIIKFFFTWLIDVLHNKGMIEY